MRDVTLALAVGLTLALALVGGVWLFGARLTLPPL